MKKYKLIAIAFLTLMGSAAAQDVKLGVKTGLNLANLSGERNNITEKHNIRTAFIFGLMAEVLISDKLAFQPELLFSAQGTKNEITIEEYKYKGTQKLNYLNIPLMAKYFVVRGFNLQFGPQVGFLLLAENAYEDNYLGMGYSERGEDISDFINTVDFGLNFGLGYQFDNGLYFDARYNFGLTNVRNDKDELFDMNQKNRVIQFSIGYFLN